MPGSPPRPVLDELARLAAARPAVVLDDDPTGTQTLRDVPVLTEWSASAIARHLDAPVLFLSTNSRSLDEAAAVELAGDAVRAALEAARERGLPISLVSRSDSTLRGHFPAEPLAMAQAAGMPQARLLLAPFFAEGGRVTVDDVHYLVRDGRQVPVAETEFARDPDFGYRSSNLREWVAEKFARTGRPAPSLSSLGLEFIRGGGAPAVANVLRALPAGGVAVINAEHDSDIETVALGALLAEEAGLPLVARVAASYVRARAGRPSAPPLTPDELPASGPGVVVVGSHVETTTRQLEALRERGAGAAVFHEVSVASLLAADWRGTTDVAAATAYLEAALAEGRTGVLLTERRRRNLDLAEARVLSVALAGIVGSLARRPAWVLAKGGITSSDVAVHGLGMRSARVAGQLLPGVPVWVGEAGSRWPGLPLVVFPGNVGGPEALADAIALLSGRPVLRS